MKDEGKFDWIGPGFAVQGTAFYNANKDKAVNGYYNNWADGEPSANSDAEDCVEMRSAGMWNDRNCYAPNAYFIVEFGFPSTMLPDVPSWIRFRK